MSCRPGCSEPAKLLGPPVDDPEIDFGEADQPIAGFGFGDAHRLANQRLAEEDHLTAPADLAIAADPCSGQGQALAQGVIGIVPELPLSYWDKAVAMAGSGSSAAPGRALHAAGCR